jgi:hypothetical protein
VDWLAAFIADAAKPRFFGDSNEMPTFGRDKLSEDDRYALAEYLMWMRGQAPAWDASAAERTGEQEQTRDEGGEGADRDDSGADEPQTREGADRDDSGADEGDEGEGADRDDSGADEPEKGGGED